MARNPSVSCVPVIVGGVTSQPTAYRPSRVVSPVAVRVAASIVVGIGRQTLPLS